jgi:hypothetical protein
MRASRLPSLFKRASSSSLLRSQVFFNYWIGVCNDFVGLEYFCNENRSFILPRLLDQFMLEEPPSAAMLGKS